MKPYSTKFFTAVAASKVLVAEASDLDLDNLHNIMLKSHKTGKVAMFEHVNTERDAEGDILCWDYKPTTASFVTCPELAGWTVRILND